MRQVWTTFGKPFSVSDHNMCCIAGAQGNRVGMGNNNDYEQMLMRDDGNRGGFNSAMGQQGMGYGSGGKYQISIGSSLSIDAK